MTVPAGESLSKAVAAFLDDTARDLIGARHRLHQHPELSWQEEQTTAYLVDVLERRGLRPRVLRHGTGVICDIGPGEAGRVALRGDIDALPIDDPKDVPYRSQNPGVCHSCGHDVHTTAVLGAGLALAAVYNERPDALNGGGVRLIFQPAEEDVPSGAPMVIADDGLDDVSEIYALHCDPRLRAGTVGLRSGPISAAADSVRIRLSGPGGHTARPQLTVDLVGLAAKVVSDLTFGVSRLTDSRGGVNLTFGSLHAGSAMNVIPTEANLAGSLRVLDRASWEAMPDLVENLLENSVRPYGADYELDYRQGAPPVVNDVAKTAFVDEVARRELGSGSVVAVEQSVGGDDFSWYLEHVPGCYIRLGVRGQDDTSPLRDLHDGAFDVDETSILVGARLLASVAAGAAARR